MSALADAYDKDQEDARDAFGLKRCSGCETPRVLVADGYCWLCLRAQYALPKLTPEKLYRATVIDPDDPDRCEVYGSGYGITAAAVEKLKQMWHPYQVIVEEIR